MTYDKLDDQQKKRTIESLYIKDGKSFNQIAEELQTYANKVRRDAKRLGISIRNKSEAQKNALDTGSHKHPTKGKNRSQDTKNKIGLSVLKNWENLSDSELNQRKLKAKQQWDKLSEDEKQNLISSANKAVRESSKTGSKLEKYLFTQLLKAGYKVEFHKEQLLATTKLQIDIYIPSLNTAIEVDGPSHFLPVWGDDALNRNVKYDNKKTGLILGKGCVLIRIKQAKDYSDTRALLIWQQLDSELQKIKQKFPSSENRLINIGD